MAVFAVILDESDQNVLARLRHRYGKGSVLLLNEGTMLVRTAADKADAIAASAGFITLAEDDDPDTGGVVFKLNRSYSGMMHPKVWEWLEGRESEDSQ